MCKTENMYVYNIMDTPTDIMDTPTENPGTIKLKEIVKTLLDRGYTYKFSLPAVYKYPPLEQSVIYENNNIPPFENIQGNWRNDSSIELIFEPIKLCKLDKTLCKTLESLGYNINIKERNEYQDMVTNYEGHSLAVFDKIYTEIGTGIINGKIDINHIISRKKVRVTIKYDSNFDEENQIAYYKEDPNDEYIDYSDINFSKLDKKSQKRLRDYPATKFMISILSSGKKGGTRKKKKSNKRSNKRKSQRVRKV